MGVAAELNPELVHTDHFSEALRPKQIGAAFVDGNDILVINLRQNPFFLAPDARAVRPLIAFVALLEKLLPGSGITLGQSGGIVLDFEERIAFRTLVNDGVQRILRSALRVDALEPRSIGHRSYS